MRHAAARERLAFPLDGADLDEATRWMERLAPRIGVMKVGLELFVSDLEKRMRFGCERDRERGWTGEASVLGV